MTLSRGKEESLNQICLEISERFEIHFVEIGYERDHVHFMVPFFKADLFLFDGFFS